MQNLTYNIKNEIPCSREKKQHLKSFVVIEMIALLKDN